MIMQRLVVINVVGLTESLLGTHTPNMVSLANSSSVSSLIPPLPAVTSTVQASILTGTTPKHHGIVANGWHQRETNETFFWRQSNNLVQGNKVWDDLHALNKNITVANMFWWFNMYSNADIAVTPRPMYLADGRKIPDIWTNPQSLRSTLQEKFGQFPLFKFWGPMAGIESTQWIVDATIEVEKLHTPTLTLVYIPHLDYQLQRLGPDHPEIAKELQAVDAQVGRLIDHFSSNDIQICILSEYGIETVNDVVPINRVLREHGFITIREEKSREYLDAGSCRAFAVTDHQIAHVYVDQKDNIEHVANVLRDVSGIDKVLVGVDRSELAHNRCGEIVAISDQGKWFSHDWWEGDELAPDYQATVAIHRKPGYDPRELLFASGWKGSKVRIAMKLLCNKLGGRTLLDVITMNPHDVRGSHGRIPSMGAPSPILIAPSCATALPKTIPSEKLKDLMITWITY
jgi:predicted AlkP superfamily pyrophosphatase or phosphodiesterase